MDRKAGELLFLKHCFSMDTLCPVRGIGSISCENGPVNIVFRLFTRANDMENLHET
jgi:hypothetical protein